MLNQICLAPGKLSTIRPPGNKVWIEVKEWSNIKTTLALPPRGKRAIEDSDREGVIIAVGPEATQCKPGDWAWFVRRDGANVTCGDKTLTIVPEPYVLMTEDARRDDA